MSYLDRTFCRGLGCVKFDFCPHALTPEIQEAAEDAELQVSTFEDPMALKCYEGKPEGRE